MDVLLLYFERYVHGYMKSYASTFLGVYRAVRVPSHVSYAKAW